MALDESKDEDTIEELGGIKFLMDVQTTEVVTQSNGLNVDYLNEEHRKGYMLSLGNAGDCSSGDCGGCG